LKHFYPPRVKSLWTARSPLESSRLTAIKKSHITLHWVDRLRQTLTEVLHILTQPNWRIDAELSNSWSSNFHYLKALPFNQSWYLQSIPKQDSIINSFYIPICLHVIRKTRINWKRDENLSDIRFYFRLIRIPRLKSFFSTTTDFSET